jgi:hypothetical protein
MTPGQFFEVVIYAAMIVYILKIFRDARSGKKAKKIIGGDITEMIRKELGNDEQILYGKKQRSSIGYFVGLQLFTAFIFLIFFLLISVGCMERFTWDSGGTYAALIMGGVFLGVGIVTGLYGSYFMFKAGNTLYFVTNKRVCIRTITTHDIKSRDIAADEIIKVNIGAAAQTPSPTYYDKNEVHIHTNDGRRFKLRPNDDPYNMLKVIHEIIGTS